MTPEIERQMTTAVLLDYIDSEVADSIRSHKAVEEQALNEACTSLIERSEDELLSGFEDLYQFLVLYPRVK